MTSLANGDWSCDQCTFINTSEDLTCTACYTVRSNTKDLSVTWQWAPNSTQWIPYDYPSCLQLESAYQSGIKSVKLSQGYFADNPGYVVNFVEKTGKKTGKKSDGFTQISPNAMVRAVRRLANDDDDLFIKISDNTIIDKEKCMICQFALNGKDDEEDEENTTDNDKEQTKIESTSNSNTITSNHNNSNEDAKNNIETSATDNNSSDSSGDTMQVVKLPKCANHYFHRSCIAQWLKLKDHCPYCNVRI